MTTNARSKALAQRLGYQVWIVERFVHFPGMKGKDGKPRPGGVRQDAFGFMDLLAYRKERTLAIQATDVAHQAEHIGALRAEERVWLWLWPGHQIRALEVWAWAKHGSRGSRKLWDCTRTLLVPMGREIEAVDLGTRPAAEWREDEVLQRLRPPI